MDIQETNLRRSDFEAMHPTAKLFNFYTEKMVYFGDGSESINSQWTTWCACIGMFHLEIKEAKAQAVPKWISVDDRIPEDNILVLAMSQTVSNIFNVYNVMALDEFKESHITHWMPLPDAPQEQSHDS